MSDDGSSAVLRARPMLGLADLLQAVATLGLNEEQARIAAIAMGLGPDPGVQSGSLQRPNPVDKPRPSVRRPPVEPLPDKEPPPEPIVPPPGSTLVLETAGTLSDELPAFLKNVNPLGKEVFSEQTVTLRLPPLFEPAWIRSLVVTLLSTETPDGPIDMDRLIALVSQGRPVVDFPLLGRFSLRRGAQVLVDETPDMMPFSADAAQICASIRVLAAGAPIEILRADNGALDLLRGPETTSNDEDDPERPALSMVRKDDGEEREYKMPLRGVPIVAITDLGLRSPDRARAWLRFGVAARRAGCPFVALVPYPKSRWPRETARKLEIIPWDRRTRVGAIRRGTARAARAVS